MFAVFRVVFEGSGATVEVRSVFLSLAVFAWSGQVAGSWRWLSRAWMCGGAMTNSAAFEFEEGSLRIWPIRSFVLPSGNVDAM